MVISVRTGEEGLDSTVVGHTAQAEERLRRHILDERWHAPPVPISSQRPTNSRQDLVLRKPAARTRLDKSLFPASCFLQRQRQHELHLAVRNRGPAIRNPQTADDETNALRLFLRRSKA